MRDDLIGYDAVALAELIQKREISPIELVDLTIERIEKLNPELNAVVHKMYDQARKTAGQWNARLTTSEGRAALFCGVPFLLKDLLAQYKGAPFGAGSKAVQGYVSKVDSEIVRRYKAGGLIVLGKTNTPEFGILPTTEPAVHGPTVNPWNPSLTPGGSSGGSAAAVAAGIVPMAHGNDAGGSIRIPASCCGLFGLKPTRGRNPLGPLFGDIGGGMVHEHAVTSTVRDSAALLDVTSGPDVGDPYPAPPAARPFIKEVGTDPRRLKIGLLTRVPDGWNEETDLHPDCAAAARDAARLCESLGHVIEPVDASQLGHPNLPQTFVVLFTCFVGHAIASWENELGKRIGQDELEPATWELYQESFKTTGADYLTALKELQRFARKIAGWYHQGHYDILLSPTMRILPTRLGAFQSTSEDPEKWIRTALSFVAFTRTQNITGQPAMSVPLYWNDDNIPLGVQFAGRFGDEATLFRLASQLEQARPWAGRTPPVHFSRTP